MTGMNKMDKLASNGWIVFRLPYGQKKTPPKGFTGKKAITGEYINEMVKTEVSLYNEKTNNIGIRMPMNVVGIDVDDSSTLSGRAIRDLTQGSYRITSTDGYERYTAYYRLPEGVTSESLKNLPNEVDLISHSHRYSVIGGHPSGREYKILDMDNNEIDTLPDWNDLDLLPTGVMDLMGRTDKAIKAPISVQKTERAQLDHNAIEMANTACERSTKVYNKGVEVMSSSVSRHNGFLNAIKALNSENQKGHSIGILVRLLFDLFISMSDNDRTNEAMRMIEGLDWVDSPCTDCDTSMGVFNYGIMNDAEMENDEVINEVWIRIADKNIVFPTSNHKKAFEKKVSKNMMLDRIAKSKNRVKAEENYIKNQIVEGKTEVHNSTLRTTIEDMSVTEEDRKIAIMISFGYDRKDITREVGISNPTLKKRLKAMGERYESNR